MFLKICQSCKTNSNCDSYHQPTSNGTFYNSKSNKISFIKSLKGCKSKLQTCGSYDTKLLVKCWLNGIYFTLIIWMIFYPHYKNLVAVFTWQFWKRFKRISNISPMKILTLALRLERRQYIKLCNLVLINYQWLIDYVILAESPPFGSLLHS